ncbi:MAG: response regulator [Ignavibacteriales bacterium]|nr:response regulator [Ignavibacteriales bacterium]
MVTRKPQPSPFSPQVGEILKRVDNLLKGHDLDGAKAQIFCAKEAEPKNMYVHAYFERIELLMEERKRNMEAEEALRRKEEDERRMAEEERKRRHEEMLRQKLEAEARRQACTADAESKKSAPQRDHAEELEEYGRAVFSAWDSGVPDASRSENLRRLRTELNITSEEHAALEASAKRESYMRAFKNLWTSAQGVEGPSSLTALRRKFGVRAGEFEGLDFALIQELRQPKHRPQLVVIDDDADLVRAVTGMLQDEGFSVRGFTTSDDAYRYLLQHTPDLILADINLETSTMGGFAFFETLQEIPRLATLPFIFVSGLTDEIIVRAGKELGADDYVTKPFVNETLVSVIKGKLRRYTEMGVIHVN